MKTLKLTNILACAILMLSPLVTAAQPLARQWVQRYNGPSNGYDYAGPMTIDNSGNVYVAGQSDGVGTSNDI
ncbi:MAG TPA: SBBP repeat-containing protein, partial [Ignavibacteria bacterium]|nr:SBBP repeat-containing protein [Ignavibacteria bacterium]